MKKIFLKFIAGGALLMCSLTSEAQTDPHFTQYYTYPAWLNPALTGAFDGEYRVTGIYRNQWGTVSTPYSTAAVSGEITTNNNINFGLSLLNQSAGNGGYRYSTGYFSLSFTGLRFGANEYNRIALGLQAGAIQRRFDPTKLQFGDQWNPVTGFNPNNPTIDVFANRSLTTFDVGAGALYFNANPDTKANLYFGFSANHLTKPRDEFSGKDDAVYPMRWTGHGGVRIKLTDNFSLTPNVLYMKQGTAEEKMVGAYGQFRVASNTDFLLGANYRFDDAVTPFAGFVHNRFSLGVSYDVNTSDLGKLVKGTNSFEISLSYTGKKKVNTPVVDFICPRL